MSDYDDFFEIEKQESFKDLKEILAQENHFKNYPFCQFLGTGSALPGYWAVSSILVGVNEDNYILLDCGEGTLSQLIYCY